MTSGFPADRRIFLVGAVLCALLLCLQPEARGQSVPDSFAPIVKKAASAVVNISTTRVVQGQLPEGFPSDEQSRKFFEYFFGSQPLRKFTEHSLGSGVVVDSRGFVLTNYHVIQKATEIKVKLSDGKEYGAKVIGSDVPSDLAVLKLAGNTSGLNVADLGDSDRLQVGDWVIAVGSPFGLAETVTAGIVSAKDRSIGAGPYDDFLQTDASINPGNSGGPLVDIQGRVVGINTSIYTTSGGFMGVGFAIPINLARKVYQELITTGRVQRGWLGVAVQALTDELADHFKLNTTEGALVNSVTENSPASQAGVQSGDVILKVNNRPVQSPGDLARGVSESSPGTRAVLTVWRNGQTRELPVTLGELPAVPQENAQANRPEPSNKNQSALGLHTEDITPDIARQLGLRDNQGVVVTGVDAASPAEDQGLAVGDVIREINNRKVTNQRTYLDAISNLKPGDNVLLKIERKGSALYIAIRLPGPA